MLELVLEDGEGKTIVMHAPYTVDGWNPDFRREIDDLLEQYDL
jgi:hypothetical protein